MRKAFLILGLFIFLSQVGFSQQKDDGLTELKIVGKPEKSLNEMVGVRDVNGRLCAAIQVISDMDGFKYDSYNGVVRVDDDPGRDMVFVSPDERVIEIFKTGYKPLKIILSEIGIQLHEKDVWKVTLKGSKKEDPAYALTVRAIPGNADIFLLRSETETGATDTLRLKNAEPTDVSAGKYRLQISKLGYKTKDTTLSITKSVFIEETLQELELQTVTLRSKPAGASIYIDDFLEKRQTNTQIFKFPGKYKLKIIKPGYRDISREIEVLEGEKNTFSFNLKEFSGILTLSVLPKSAKVLLNNENYTGQSQISLMPGIYKLEVEAQGYEPYSETLIIETDQSLARTITLKENIGKLMLAVQPITAKVQLLQNNKVVESWRGAAKKSLRVGRYQVKCTAEGYLEEIKPFSLKEGKTKMLEVVLTRKNNVEQEMEGEIVAARKKLKKTRYEEKDDDGGSSLLIWIGLGAAAIGGGAAVLLGGSGGDSGGDNSNSVPNPPKRP